MKLIEKIKRMNLLEKFQNKKVFALYLVGVLLLSTGISFAYFSASTSVSGEGSVAIGVTATVTSQGIMADGNIGFNNIDIYPGHTALASIKVTGTGDNEPLIYNVIFNGTNTFNTPLNYTVYKSTSNIDASYICTKKNDYLNGSKTYYEECSGNNIESLGEPISNGTITNREGKTILKSDEIILTSLEGEVVYYYIVIEYPNLDANQNDDIKSSINGNITIEEGSKYQDPIISMIGTTTSGSNGWYTSASITTNITTQTGNYEAYYCTTTSSSCTPNTEASVSNNSFVTALSSNASAQKVCARVVDEYNQEVEGCSDAYSVDTVNPTITITNTSATTDSITVTVSGSDAHSGIYQYRFSSNGGSSYTTVSSTNSSYTYTFTGLNDGTNYNIAVQSVDKSGRASNTVTRSVETEKSGDTMQTILAGYNKGNRGSFSSAYIASTTKTVFQTTDWLGTSYYFAGAPTDNWVRFGGFYWRIVRVNGDGSVRLIYNGTSTATTGSGTMISSSQAFNSSYNRSEYVGLKYTTGQQHGQNTDSPILDTLQSWYSSSGLSATQYSQHIDTNVGFCSDRNMASGYSWSSQPSSTIYYAAYGRLDTNKSPSLACTSSDVIKEPVGLITADEVAFAGGGYRISNTSYYLYNNSYYWTMSPYHSSGRAGVFYVYSTGYLGSSVVFGSFGVRPVINLKADTKFQGSGTSTDPFTVN